MPISKSQALIEAYESADTASTIPIVQTIEFRPYIFKPTSDFPVLREAQPIIYLTNTKGNGNTYKNGELRNFTAPNDVPLLNDDGSFRLEDASTGEVLFGEGITEYQNVPFEIEAKKGSNDKTNQQVNLVIKNIGNFFMPVFIELSNDKAHFDILIKEYLVYEGQEQGKAADELFLAGKSIAVTFNDLTFEISDSLNMSAPFPKENYTPRRFLSISGG